MKKLYLILLLLLLMFAVSCVSTPEVKSEVKPAPSPMATTKINNTAIASNLKETKRGNIIIPNVLFKRESTVMIGDYKKSFNIVTNILASDTNAKIVIEGHTSVEGKAYPYNYELSKRRANAVYNYMIKNMKVSSKRLILKYYGEGLPEYKEYPKNRRVEFVVIKSDTELTNYNLSVKNVDIRKERY